MSATKIKRRGRPRAQRSLSNVYNVFNQDQIQEFKEAFNMIDQNHDGLIGRDDLCEILTSLGKNPSDGLLEDMLAEAPGQMNFTMFITLFGEHLAGTDPEDVVINAFACFDLDSTGRLSEDYLREILTTLGERWTQEQVDDFLEHAPTEKGWFDYIKFTRELKHGDCAADNDDEENKQGQTGSARQRRH